MNEEKTEEELLRALSDDDLDKVNRDSTEEQLRRQRLNRWWVCTSCGQKMGYDYVMEGDFGETLFDNEGCSSCGHTEAVEIREAATE